MSVSLLRPFAGLRPAPQFADQVAAPPYDVLSSEEARVMAAGKEWSFLHISKPEIDLPDGTDIYSPEVYAKARENLDRLVAAGIFLLLPGVDTHQYGFPDHDADMVSARGRFGGSVGEGRPRDRLDSGPARLTPRRPASAGTRTWR